MQPTRVEAAAKLARALRTSQVSGVRTNIEAMVAILGEPDFLAADTPTAYLDEHPDVLTPIGPAGGDRVALLLGAVFALEAERRSADRARRSRRRAGATCARRANVTCGSSRRASTSTSSS